MNKEHRGIEIERKYVIALPCEEELSRMPEYTRSEITQIYLPTVNGVTHRVRKRVRDGVAVYTETRKIRIDAMSSEEIEREIEADEFDRISLQKSEDSRPILKTRYTFIYFGQLFEIDVYPEWKKSAILETELEDRGKEVLFPDFIRIIKDVTGNKLYSNAAMSKAFPEELICDTACPQE